MDGGFDGRERHFEPIRRRDYAPEPPRSLVWTPTLMCLEMLAAWSLMPAFSVLWAFVLASFVVFAWSLNLVSLPGNWLAIGATAVYVWLGPSEGRMMIGVQTLVIVFVTGIVGEIAEFFAAAAGAQRAGASRRSTVLALIGSIAGAIFGAIVGIPIPAVGSIIAAVLFGGLGATAGAMLGEWSDGKTWRDSWAVGHAAFWGRTIGMFAKLGAGLLVVTVVLVALVV